MKHAFAALRELRDRPKNLSETDQRHWRLRPGVHLLKSDAGALLVLFQGHRRWLKAREIETFGSKFFAWAREPFKSADMVREFANSLEPAECVQFLETLRSASLLITVVDPASQSGSQENPSENRVARFLEPYVEDWESRRQLGSMVENSEIAYSLSEEIVTTPFKNANAYSRTTFPGKIVEGDRVINVIVSSVDNFAFIDRLNREALTSQTPALCVLVDDTGFYLGPVIGLSGQPCLECMQLRRRASQGRLFRSESAFEKTELSCWPDHFWTKLVVEIEMELLRLQTLYTHPASLEGSVVHDLINGRSLLERLFKYPGCPSCQRVKPSR